MKGQISYMVPLWNLANNFTPKRILELGCGCSTYILRWMWDKAHITVIDDHPSWMMGVIFMGGHYRINNWEVVRDLPEWKGAISKYHLIDDPWDLIFVDMGHVFNGSGKYRIALIDYILEVACLAPEGKMILHDANDPNYQDVINRHGFCQLDGYDTAIYHHGMPF